MSHVARSRLQVETVDGVTVAGFADDALLSDEVIREVGEQLDQLLDAVGPGRYLVSFRGVSYLSSMMLAVLIKFARRLEKAGGRLKLCALAPALREVFQIGQFDRLFEIHDLEAEAFDAFESRRS